MDSLPTILRVLMVLASLLWLFFLVKIPWDLYFAARRGRVDAQESLSRGIAVAPADLRDLTLLERRLLWAAIAAHALTAAGVWLIGRLSGGAILPEFAWLFLFSATFRPAWEGHKYLRRRLAELSGRVRYPREDLLQLLDRFEKVVARMDCLEGDQTTLRVDLTTRLDRLETYARQGQERQADDVVRLGSRVSELATRFEQAVAQMSSDKELLAGVRAFARMFRQDEAQR